MKIGDLVHTVQGYSHKVFYGLIVDSEDVYFKLLLTESTSLGEITHWFQGRHLEVVSESR